MKLIITLSNKHLERTLQNVLAIAFREESKLTTAL